MKTKQFCILLMSFFISVYVTAQSDTALGREWRDVSKIPAASMPQHNEFLNNQYPYPSKPRNMWELGFGVGPSFVIGDVNSKVGIGGSVSLRKAVNHTFSARFSYTGMLNSGTPSSYGTAIGQVEYKSQTHSLGFDVIASLNTKSYYRGNPKVNYYLLGGYTLIGTKVFVKTPGPQAQPGGYNIFYGIGNPNSQDGLIGTAFGAEINGRHGFSLMHGLNLGGGVAFKLSDRMNIGFEQKFIMTMPGYDFLDGFRGGNNNDYFSLTTFRLNFNLGNSARRVQPLWWINPNNYVYSELNTPRHMKLPPVVLPDADGDGVTDQFDLEPNTPAGAPVDSHGRAKDTDGDGVPDYKDKEVLTPLNCFPVNNDGVGTCPEPACCKEIRDLLNSRPVATAPQCNIGSLPSIRFTRGTTLSRDAQSLLASAAASINANPNCKIKITGYGASSKAAQQLSWDRVNAVIKYLVEKQGISESRFIFNYGQDGESNTVDLQGTTEEGPNTVPAPHPNLRRG